MPSHSAVLNVKRFGNHRKGNIDISAIPSPKRSDMISRWLLRNWSSWLELCEASPGFFDKVIERISDSNNFGIFALRISL